MAIRARRDSESLIRAGQIEQYSSERKLSKINILYVHIYINPFIALYYTLFLRNLGVPGGERYSFEIGAGIFCVEYLAVS